MTIPPLLAIAEGRRVRLRKPVVKRPKELGLHLAVAALLRRFAEPEWRWGHYPAGELRDARTAAKLRAMGMQAGWPDIILFSPAGKLYALELKRQGEGLSDDQKQFQTWCVGKGLPHAVAWSVDEARTILDSWRVLRKIGGVQ